MAEKLNTKVTFIDKQKCIVLPIKNFLQQVQNLNKNALEVQELVHKLENKTSFYSDFLSFIYNDNTIKPAISLFSTNQNIAIINLAMEYN